MKVLVVDVSLAMLAEYTSECLKVQTYIFEFLIFMEMMFGEDCELLSTGRAWKKVVSLSRVCVNVVFINAQQMCVSDKKLLPLSLTLLTAFDSMRSSFTF